MSVDFTRMFFKLREDAKIPERATEGSAGFDLFSLEPYNLMPGNRADISTGIGVMIPDGHVGMVCPRSGMAIKWGVTVLNGPGIIDHDYRGELRVILINFSPMPYHISVGDAIAQIVVIPVVLGGCPSKKRSGGFGSTDQLRLYSGVDP